MCRGPASLADVTLARVLAAPPPARIADVVDRLEAIEAALSPRDGVAAFTHLYLEVTREVQRVLRPGFFEDARFVRLLDVVFADLFFEVDRLVGLAGRGLLPRWTTMRWSFGSPARMLASDVEPVGLA
jgi:hypothetical protein